MRAAGDLLRGVTGIVMTAALNSSSLPYSPILASLWGLASMPRMWRVWYP